MKIRKILSLILSLIIILTALPLTAVISFAETSGDFEYEILDDGTVELTKYNGSATSLSIPSKLGSYTVSSIGLMAFAQNSQLKSVTIASSVKHIGPSAFQECTDLENISIPDSVNYISFQAFANTAYYNNTANWENNALYIGNHLISANVSGSYSVKSGTKTIAYEAFNRRNLNEVVLPDSMRYISEYAFCYCKITKITIPSSVEFIDESAFDGCSKSMIICGYENSTAQTFANNNGFTFAALCLHLNTELRNEKSASCKETGYTGDIFCTDCGALITKGENTEKLAHTAVTDPAVAPTETETGLTEGSHCSVCGEVIKAQEVISALGSSDPEPAPDPIPEPEPTPDDPTPDIILGDTNNDGKLSVVDAKWILQSIAGTREFTPEQKAAADINGDGKLSVVDAKWILQAIAGTRVLGK